MDLSNYTTTATTTTTTTATATASSSGSTYAILDHFLDSPERKDTDQIEMSSNPRSTESESSVDLYIPKVTKRRTLEDYDKGHSYNFREIAADVHHRHDSTESEDNCIDDQKKRNKIQNVKKSKKTKLSDKTKPSDSEFNEIVVEDDIRSNRPRGQNLLFYF